MVTAWNDWELRAFYWPGCLAILKREAGYEPHPVALVDDLILRCDLV